MFVMEKDAKDHWVAAGHQATVSKQMGSKLQPEHTAEKRRQNHARAGDKLQTKSPLLFSHWPRPSMRIADS
jgi:hypothetical protein